MRMTLKEIGEAEDSAERQDAVIAAVQAGNSVDAVAVVASLPVETVRAWVREAEDRALRQQARARWILNQSTRGLVARANRCTGYEPLTSRGDGDGESYATAATTDDV
jgi:hypothetical protein